jgi:cysteine desulfuration protein SufE
MTADQAMVPPKLAELVEDFQSITDRQERTEMLIELADQFESVPERIAARPFPEDHRVPACESEAYVWTEDLPGGALKYHFAVENPQGLSAMAMAVALDQTLSGQPIEQVAAVSPDIVYAIFGGEISMGKGQGLMRMVSMVQQMAKQRMTQ